MKLANPLYYPSTILVAAIALIAGVRLAKLPLVVMVPVSGAIAVAGATLRKSQEPETLNLDNPELEAELLIVHRQAKVLADKASELRLEATHLLTESTLFELLATVQHVCDRASHLPAKIDQLAQRMQNNASLLSVADLQNQLAELEQQRSFSAGAPREPLAKVVESLKHTIELAQSGQDARQVQVASLSALILDALGVLQELHGKLRSANLTDTKETLELRSLSDELSIFQENVEFLVG